VARALHKRLALAASVAGALVALSGAVSLFAYDVISFHPRLVEARRLRMNVNAPSPMKCRFPHGDPHTDIAYKLLFLDEGRRWSHGEWILASLATDWLVRLHVSSSEQRGLFEALLARHPQRIPALMNDCTN
jgi:hypothetical protein